MVMQNAVNKLLHMLEVGTLPINAVAVWAAAKEVVDLEGFGRQALAELSLLNRLQHRIAMQTACKRRN